MAGILDKLTCDFVTLAVFYAAMETKIAKVDTGRPDSEIIAEAGRIIDAGGLVAFPTETVYGIACRAKNDSLARLSEIKGRGAEKYYTLHIGWKSDVAKYVPGIGLRARKLIDKAWPGPVTIVFELDSGDLEKQRNSLEAEVFDNLYKENSIGIRCPDNAVASALLRAGNSAVVAPSANITGQNPAVDGKQVLVQLSGKIDLLLDAGECKYKQSSTVVKIGKSGLQVLREGVYSESQLEQMAMVKFLFVCSGNTCRSPIAEGLFKKYWSEKLGCNIDQLEEMGYKMSSAGTLGFVDGLASMESVAACQAKGVDISGHRSQALSSELIADSDFIFVMSESHRQRIVGLCPTSANKCELMAVDKDVADPIGQSQEVYNSCADMIETAVQHRISEFEV